MTQEKTLKLYCGGKITYRLPNCIEQVRFFVDSKWHQATYMLEQVEHAIPLLEKFIVKIDSKKFESFEDIVNDRGNVAALKDFALDIGNNQKLTEAKKKS